MCEWYQPTITILYCECVYGYECSQHHTCIFYLKRGNKDILIDSLTDWSESSLIPCPSLTWVSGTCRCSWWWSPGTLHTDPCTWPAVKTTVSIHVEFIISLHMNLRLWTALSLYQHDLSKGKLVLLISAQDVDAILQWHPFYAICFGVRRNST